MYIYTWWANWTLTGQLQHEPLCKMMAAAALVAKGEVSADGQTHTASAGTGQAI